MAVSVFFATASVALGYPSRQSADWLFLLPLVTPLIAAVIATVLLFLRTRSPVISGLLWGAFAGANLLLIHQTLRLLLQNELIRRDGAAYWGLLSIPALYGLGALGLGAVLGMGAAFIGQRMSARGIERGAPPNGDPGMPTRQP